MSYFPFRARDPWSCLVCPYDMECDVHVSNYCFYDSREFVPLIKVNHEKKIL